MASEGPYKEPLRAIVTIAHKSRDILEIKINMGQRLLLLEPRGEWWYIARLPNGKEGWVPAKHLRVLKPIEHVNLPELFINWWEKKEAALGNDILTVPTTLLIGKDKDKLIRCEKLTKDTFPFPTPDISLCNLVGCKARKMEKGLGVCAHDMERFLKAGLGEEIYCAKWLWRESLC